MLAAVTSSWCTPGAIRQCRCGDPSLLDVSGPLHGAEGARLRREVETLIGRGSRSIEMRLAGASSIDAAGIGELVRAYNITAAASGVLRVREARGLVRELLDRVGLLEVLTRGA